MELWCMYVRACEWYRLIVIDRNNLSMRTCDVYCWYIHAAGYFISLQLLTIVHWISILKRVFSAYLRIISNRKLATMKTALRLKYTEIMKSATITKQAKLIGQEHVNCINCVYSTLTTKLYFYENPIFPFQLE